MNKHKQPSAQNKGFTIIEVVLVLAIAGLIFLMVFIALPALQRGQRDTQRKDDLSRINTQLSNYQSSNRGKIPTETQFVDNGTGFVMRYLKGSEGGAHDQSGPDEYADPTSGEGYRFVTGPQATLDEGYVNYQSGTVCGTDGDTTSGSGRQYTLRIKLENQDALYCIDNK